MPGAVALDVVVADRVLADVAPREAADDLLGPGSGVREDRDEGAVAQVELRADRPDLGRQEDVRLARPLVTGFVTPAAALCSTSSSLTAKLTGLVISAFLADALARSAA